MTKLLKKIDWSNLLIKELELIQKILTIKFGLVATIKLLLPQRKSLVKDFEFNLTKLREFFLDNNAGIKIYRDRIVVKPYGFPKFLNLDMTARFSG